MAKAKGQQQKPDTEPQAAFEAIARPIKDSGASYTFTPSTLVSLLRSADQGDMSAQTALFSAMEDRDAKLDGFMRQRKLGLLACGWELEEPEQNPQRSMDLCMEVLGSIPALNDRLFDLLDALGKGFAVTEIVWETSSGQWRPANLEYRPQAWFCLNETGDGLNLRSQQNLAYGVPMNPLNFILHRHRARSGFDPRIGLYRSCARPFVIRNYGWQNWLAFAEVFGMPVRIGKLPPGATDAEKEAMWAAVQAIGVDAAAVISKESEIDFPTGATNAAANANVFSELVKQAEDEYVIAILGQRLSTGGDSGGSYALGKVHEGVRFDLVDSDAQRLSDTLTNQLLKPLVELNLGPDAPVPRWHWRVEMPEDMSALATVVKTLGEAGLAIPASWVRAKFGIPAPEEAEEVLTAPAAPAPFKGAAPVVAARVPFPSGVGNRPLPGAGTDRLTSGSSPVSATWRSYGIRRPGRTDSGPTRRGLTT